LVDGRSSCEQYAYYGVKELLNYLRRLKRQLHGFELLFCFLRGHFIESYLAA
jgi:hypothetical protein